MKIMRVILWAVLALLFAGNANSQMNLIIFSEAGEKFTAFVNQAQVNDEPETRIQTDRPGGPNFKVRIVFEDKTIPELTKTIFNTPGPDMFYVIKGSGSGKHILEKTASEYVIHDSEAAPEEEVVTEVEEQPVVEEPAGTESDGDKTAGGCINPIEEPNFEVIKNVISNAPFDGPKLTQAKNMANKHCLTTSQIIDIMYIFSSEPTRLNFAKYAYKHCYDPGNYDQVKEALLPPSQIQLEKYLEAPK